MKDRILYLTFTDMLLYSLLVKSRSKLNQEEAKPNIYYTPPQAYFWIFLLNLKNKIILSTEKEYILVRLTFWVLQIIYHLKDSFRNKINQKINLLYFYSQFKNELSHSNLNTEQKLAISRLTEEKIHLINRLTQKILSKNFDNLSLKEIEYWGNITYDSIAKYFVKIYFIISDIQLTDPKAKDSILFAKQISNIEALHDDITDIFIDFAENLHLKEPNYFYYFLSDQDKDKIVASRQNRSISVEEAEKIFPHAFKQYKKLVGKRIKEVASVSRINIHQFLEFCFYHYPVYLSTHYKPENIEKKSIAFTSINYLALQKSCVSVIEKFQRSVMGNRIKGPLEKQFSDLLHYVYCHQLFQLGLSNKEIAKIMNIHFYTVSRWLHQKTLPISIRQLKEKPITNNDNKWYLLGIFCQAGTVTDGYFQIIRSKPILEKISDQIKSSKNIIFKIKKHFYLRYYNARLARIVHQMKNNMPDILKDANTVEKKDYFEGLNTVTKKNIPVEMQQKNVVDQYSRYAKSLILRYFGSQKKEFWDEFPSLLYLCLSKTTRIKQYQIKFDILDYFKKYFRDITRTTIHNKDTYDIEHVEDEKDELENIGNFDNHRLAKALSVLKNKNKKQYFVVALRFGFLDGEEHTLTDDLSLRLFDHGVNYKNKPLSKAQTYQLLQSSISHLRLLIIK